MERVSNNVLFLLALVFFSISLINLFIVYQTTPSGHLLNEGTARIDVCIRHPPTLSQLNISVEEKLPYSAMLSYANPDGYDILFDVNASFISIDQVTGYYNFTPAFYQVGNHTVRFNLTELDAICRNYTSIIDARLEVLGEQENDSLAVWDDTSRHNLTKYRNAFITFYANYTNNYTKTLVNGSSAYCKVSFNLSRPWMNYSENLTYPELMSLELVNNSWLYTFSRSFPHPGNYSYYVMCNASLLKGLSNITRNATAYVTNRNPRLLHTMPAESWNMNTILIGRDIDDYFTDPDDDPLVFNVTFVPQITIIINSSNHIIKYNPAFNFEGVRIARFTAFDPLGASAESNLVFLYVLYVPPVAPSPPGPSGGGGLSVACDPFWDCTDWSICMPNGIQIRSCSDLSECGTNKSRPAESQKCLFTSSCSDNIKNCHDGSCEVGVDCGGPCDACPTCSDGLQNQGEVGVDCGGPCDACPSCFDRTKNQGETGVDCGGPCAPCKANAAGPVTESPAGISLARMIIIGGFAIAATGLLVLGLSKRKLIIVMLKRMAARLRALIEGLKNEKIAVKSYGEIALDKLDALEAKIGRQETSILVKELSSIGKFYFKAYLKLSYEFTHEELVRELSKVMIPADVKAMSLRYIRRLMDREYAGRFTNDDLKLLVAELRSIIYKATPEAVSLMPSSPATCSLLELISKAELAIAANDSTLAVHYYQVIGQQYELLKPDDKKSIYSRILRVYQQIQGLNTAK